MRLEWFDFDLPPERIAQHPVEPRDAARLLLVHRDRLEDSVVRELPRHLASGDLLVVNDTRVLPVRFFARRGAARIELTLVSALDQRRWRALAKGAKRLRVGDELELAPDLTATVVGRDAEGGVILAFALEGEALLAAIQQHGAMPLPPYIRRAEPLARDRIDYQTLFARRDGAVAAPTAGLHFTERLLQQLEAHGIGLARVTLHVGIGTFLPVRAADLRQHVMHGEWYEVPAETAKAIAETRQRGGAVVAVGTTVVRTLETAARDDGTVIAGSGDTSLYILPGFRFRVVDRLLTNFHLPKSTLFALVCAFAGYRRMHAAYRHAIAQGYRFFSYGDACLLDRQAGDDLPPEGP
jgi:S-adenosylmethionine:tRNA ribosyltransferase-isomerase